MPHEPLEGEVRCAGCRKKLAEFVDGEAVIKCPRCKRVNVFDTRKQSSVSSLEQVEQLI